jgi:hypothetical protein
MSDRPAGVKATRSPWTDGAWIMHAVDVPVDWEMRRYQDYPFARHPRYQGHVMVEARP